jgi:hypothetical protein
MSRCILAKNCIHGVHIAVLCIVHIQHTSNRLSFSRSFFIFTNLHDERQ